MCAGKRDGQVEYLDEVWRAYALWRNVREQRTVMACAGSDGSVRGIITQAVTCMMDTKGEGHARRLVHKRATRAVHWRGVR